MKLKFDRRVAVTAFLALSLSINCALCPANAAEKTASTNIDTNTNTNISTSTSQPWWKSAVFYEIYPRSFADSDNNGMGDIKGITSKLDYLQDLGVDALWITPCYPSPQVDFGYDISDYTAIAPEYGTMADFDELIVEAKKRNIGILMDFVMNHTSDKHPWFVESASSKDNPKRDWYIWRDGKSQSGKSQSDKSQSDKSQPGEPPNNWVSLFGGSAWKYYPQTKQFNYHFFYPQQPDLNWRNPEVKKAMFDAARFWLDKGVAGFRLDAVQTLFEDPALTDNPVREGKNQYGDANTEYKFNDKLPEVHDVLRDLRSLLDSYPGDRVLIGETSGSDIAEISKTYGKNLDEVQLPMNFILAYVNKLSPVEFRQRIEDWDKNPARGWPLHFFSNHDQVRHYVRYAEKGADKATSDKIAKLMAALLLTVRGTPIMYYGEELGMTNRDPATKEEVQDPIGKLGWPAEIGRDGERTPMQWSEKANAGFSIAKTWLPVAPGYEKVNVATELKDKDSVLNFYKSLINLRRHNEAIENGAYVPVDENNKGVLSYLRKSEFGSAVILLNMSAQPQVVQLDLKNKNVMAKSAKKLLASFEAPASFELNSIQLPPYGVYIGQLDKMDECPD